MAVKIEERNGWLCYRVCLHGEQWRETTGVRATAKKKRATMESKAQTMSDLMGEGAFDYLTWFPDGVRADRYRPKAPEVREAMTVAAYARDVWMPRSQPPHVRLSLTKTRAKHLKHILPVFGECRFPDLTETALEDFKVALTRPIAEGGKGLKLKTARCILDSTFRALYRDARTIDYRRAFGTDRPVATDPFAVVAWKRDIAPEPDPFTEEERDILLTHFRARKRHYYPFVYMLFSTGMRIGEAVALRWGDIDLRRGRFTVRRSRTLGEDNPPKTAKAYRTQTLPAETTAVLRAIQPLRVTETGFVFTTEAGTPMDAEKFVENHWRPALRACTVRPRRLYDCRHTFISIALTRGAKIKWIATYCGTSVEMIERHYGKWMDGDDDQLALLATPAAISSVKVA